MDIIPFVVTCTKPGHIRHNNCFTLQAQVKEETGLYLNIHETPKNGVWADFAEVIAEYVYAQGWMFAIQDDAIVPAGGFKAMFDSLQYFDERMIGFANFISHTEFDQPWIASKGYVAGLCKAIPGRSLRGILKLVKLYGTPRFYEKRVLEDGALNVAMAVLTGNAHYITNHTYVDPGDLPSTLGHARYIPKNLSGTAPPLPAPTVENTAILRRLTMNRQVFRLNFGALFDAYLKLEPNYTITNPSQ